MLSEAEASHASTFCHAVEQPTAGKKSAEKQLCANLLLLFAAVKCNDIYNVKLKGILITLFLFLSLIPAWYINRWLQGVIQPRKSFAQFLLYLLLCFALVFFYTFLVTFIIFKLLPPPHR